MIQLTQVQAEQVEWALGDMADFWTTEDGAEGRDGKLYPESDLPVLDGLSLTISPIEEINADLLYRLEIQLPDMADMEGTSIAKGKARAATNAATAIRKADPRLALLPHGGGWIT